MSTDTRVGIGYDIHRLEEGRKLILGGVAIEFHKGLIGHSDADAVLHAVIDALLGAAGLPDIGELYPDTDPAYQDADSRELMSDTMKRLGEKGLVVGNIDLVIHAEAPRMSPHKSRVAASIAELVGVQVGQVSVKAKTNEGMGPLGMADAIACTAVALVRSA